MLLPTPVDRDTALVVLLGALAVVALGVAAATLDSAVVVGGGGGGGFGVGDGGGVGSGDAPSVGVGSRPGGGTLLAPVCLPWLTELPAIAAILAAFLIGGYLLYRRTRSVIPPVAVSLAVAMPLFLVWVFLTACERSSDRETSRGLVPSRLDGGAFLPAGGGGGPGAEGSVVSNPEALLALVLGLAVVGAVAMLFVGTGDDEERTDDPGSDVSAPPDVAAIGRAAGAAADRIEGDAGVDNEVYRAWREMTDLLDVPNPESSTAAEFADAAVAAGMDRGDVAELTRLFETIRYGGATPTEERERRAVEALRRIESTYAEAAAS